MTALGHSSGQASSAGVPAPLPFTRALTPEPLDLASALVESPKTRFVYRAAWPVFGVTLLVGFVGAHFGKPSYLASVLAVVCLLVRFLPGIRARAQALRQGVERVTLSSDGIQIEAYGQRTDWQWAQASYYQASVGLVLRLPRRALPCVLSRSHFTPLEYQGLLELLRAKVRPTPRTLDFALLAAMLLCLFWVAWRTWRLST